MRIRIHINYEDKWILFLKVGSVYFFRSKPAFKKSNLDFDYHTGLPVRQWSFLVVANVWMRRIDNIDSIDLRDILINCTQRDRISVF